MIERIILALVTQAGSALLSYVLARTGKRQTAPIEEAEIDTRLAAVKAAYAEALDGHPVTKGQREKINTALRELIRGDSRRL